MLFQVFPQPRPRPVIQFLHLASPQGVILPYLCSEDFNTDRVVSMRPGIAIILLGLLGVHLRAEVTPSRSQAKYALIVLSFEIKMAIDFEIGEYLPEGGERC